MARDSTRIMKELTIPHKYISGNKIFSFTYRTTSQQTGSLGLSEEGIKEESGSSSSDEEDLRASESKKEFSSKKEESPFSSSSSSSFSSSASFQHSPSLFSPSSESRNYETIGKQRVLPFEFKLL